MSKKIVVKAEKVAARGEKKIRIIDFKLKEQHKLPLRYLNSNGVIAYQEMFLGAERMVVSKISITGNTSKGVNTLSTLSIGELISEGEFNRLIENLELAGQHLHEVNQELKRELAGWNGEIIVEI